MRRRLILNSLLALLSFASAVNAQERKTSEVEFNTDDGPIVATVTLARRVDQMMAISFMLPSSYDFSTLKKQGFDFPAKMVAQGVTSSSTPVAVVPFVEFGGERAIDVDMYWDGAGILPPSRRRTGVQGILGFNFFNGEKKRIVQIDLKRSVIRFLKDAPPATGATVVRFSNRKIEIGWKIYSRLIVEDFQIGDKKIPALIDFDSPAEILLQSRATCEDSKLKIQKCAKLNLGGLEKADAAFVLEVDYLNSLKSEVAIGRGFFSGKLVTFDFTKKTLTIEASK